MSVKAKLLVALAGAMVVFFATFGVAAGFILSRAASTSVAPRVVPVPVVAVTAPRQPEKIAWAVMPAAEIDRILTQNIRLISSSGGECTESAITRQWVTAGHCAGFLGITGSALVGRDTAYIPAREYGVPKTSLTVASFLPQSANYYTKCALWQDGIATLRFFGRDKNNALQFVQEYGPAIGPGCSGSPVIGEWGQVVGVVTDIYVDDNTGEYVWAIRADQLSP